MRCAAWNVSVRCFSLDCHYVLHVYKEYFQRPFDRIIAVSLLPIGTASRPIGLVQYRVPYNVAFPKPTRTSPIRSSNARPCAVFIPPRGFCPKTNFINGSGDDSIVPYYIGFILGMLNRNISANARVSKFRNRPSIVEYRRNRTP